MNRKKSGPFTLFLCLILVIFILFAPHFLERPDLDEFTDKIFRRELEWTGIITIWDYPRYDITTGYNYSWLRDKIKKFERQNPGVFIEFHTLDPDYGYIQIDTAVKTKTYPDIAPVGADFELISKGVLEPLDDYLTPEEINDYKFQAISAVKHNGHIWGFPYMIENYSLFLNLDLFKERDVAPPKDGNWTYEEFLNTLRKLTFDRNKDGKTDCYGFNSHISPNYYGVWGIILSDGAEIADEKSFRYKFYGEKAISGLKKLVDLKLVHGVTPDNFGVNTENEAWRSFAVDKKVAVYPAKTSVINKLKVINSTGKGFNFDVANYPIGDSGIPMSAGNPVTAFGIFKQPDKKKLEMCVKFLKFLTDEESQRQLYKQGVFPVKKSAGNIYKNDKLMLKIEKSLAYTKNIENHTKWKLVDDVLQSQVRMALTGKKTVEEAISQAKTMIEQAGGH